MKIKTVLLALVVAIFAFGLPSKGFAKTKQAQLVKSFVAMVSSDIVIGNTTAVVTVKSEEYEKLILLISSKRAKKLKFKDFVVVHLYKDPDKDSNLTFFEMQD